MVTVLHAFMWLLCYVYADFFTTKITKGSDNYPSELRVLRGLRGENIFTVNLEEAW
jgi:hypothetical protein